MKSVTITATNLLAQVLDNCSKRQYNQLSAAVQANIERLKEPLRTHNKESVTFHVMKEVDEMMQRQVEWPKIKCRKGCAHCCHINVDISEGEAALIHHYCHENGIKIDRSVLETQKTLAAAERPLNSASKCVFLSDDNTCRIYPVRPLNCRKYLVQSQPAFCNAVQFKGKIVEINLEINTEIMVTGFHTVMDELDNMAIMLLNQINQHENDEVLQDRLEQSKD